MESEARQPVSWIGRARDPAKESGHLLAGRCTDSLFGLSLDDRTESEWRDRSFLPAPSSARSALVLQLARCQKLLD